MRKLTFHLYERSPGEAKDFNQIIGALSYAVEVTTGMNVSYAEWGEDEDPA